MLRRCALMPAIALATCLLLTQSGCNQTGSATKEATRAYLAEVFRTHERYDQLLKQAMQRQDFQETARLLREMERSWANISTRNVDPEVVSWSREGRELALEAANLCEEIGRQANVGRGVVKGLIAAAIDILVFAGQPVALSVAMADEIGRVANLEQRRQELIDKFNEFDRKSKAIRQSYGLDYN